MGCSLNHWSLTFCQADEQYIRCDLFCSLRFENMNFLAVDAFLILSWYVLSDGIFIDGFGGSLAQSGFVTLSFVIEYLTG